MFALDACPAEVDILSVVVVETCHHTITGELLQTSCVEVSKSLVPQGVRILMCNAGMLAGLTVKIVEISHSSCLGNHAPIRSSDLAATVVELSDLSSLSSLRDTLEVMQQCWHIEHILEASHSGGYATVLAHRAHLRGFALVSYPPGASLSEQPHLS